MQPRPHDSYFQGSVGNRDTRGREINRFTGHNRNWNEKFQLRDGPKRGEVPRSFRSETWQGVHRRAHIGRTDVTPLSGNIRGRGRRRQQILYHEQYHKPDSYR